MITPRTPSGTLELLPRDQIAMQRMADTVRHAFEAYGFLPISTPTFEHTDVLLTKTGGETERQVYFVESTGALEKQGEGLPELALRFDLTVPLARYVAQYERQLTFPFRRYQLQPVFRGERPQRGRFREFTQCDVDIIGHDRLDVRYDAEPVAVIVAIYTEFGFGPFTVNINNRRLLRGLLASLGVTEPERQTLVLREVDKVDKRGVDYLRRTLTGEGFAMADADVDAIVELMGAGVAPYADAKPKLDALRGRNDELDAGIDELVTVCETLLAMGVAPDCWGINFALARGLDYYTGTIYETRLDNFPELGSVAGGGRYENLAGNYTSSKLPGVGISIGLTRLFWQLREAGLIDTADSTVQVLVTLMEDALLPESLALAAQLRAGGIRVESVMEPSKLGKQFKYADRAGIRFVAVLGDSELAEGTVTIKDLRRQDQFTVPRADAAKALRVELAAAEAELPG